MEVLECLKKYGQRLDTEIAEEMGIPLEAVRKQLVELASKGDVITCQLTRYEQGRGVESWQCRVSGYHPPKAPGRKPSSA